MGYTPKSEEQLAEEGLLADGIYDYEIFSAEEKISKAGNDMYVLGLHIFDNEGGQRTITDYIALGSNYGERKLRHACDASNMIAVYESGNLVAEDFLNKTGKLTIGKQDGTTEYPTPKNVVKGYVKRDIQSKQPVDKVVEGDDIPF